MTHKKAPACSLIEPDLGAGKMQQITKSIFFFANLGNFSIYCDTKNENRWVKMMKKIVENTEGINSTYRD